MTTETLTVDASGGAGGYEIFGLTGLDVREMLSSEVLAVAAGMAIHNTTGVFSWTPDLSQSGQFFDVTVTVTDAGNPPLSDSIMVTIEVAGSRWHNSQQPQDVNNDGRITPDDALIIINRLNAIRSGHVPEPPASGPPFYDVNGDDYITPVDALVVINYLNRQGGGEGEASRQVVRNDAPSTWLPVVICPSAEVPLTLCRSMPRAVHSAMARPHDLLLTGDPLELDPTWQFLEDADWLPQCQPDAFVDLTDLDIDSETETLLAILADKPRPSRHRFLSDEFEETP